MEKKYKIVVILLILVIIVQEMMIISNYSIKDNQVKKRKIIEDAMKNTCEITISGAVNGYQSGFPQKISYEKKDRGTMFSPKMLPFNKFDYPIISIPFSEWVIFISSSNQSQQKGSIAIKS